MPYSSEISSFLSVVSSCSSSSSSGLWPGPSGAGEPSVVLRDFFSYKTTSHCTLLVVSKTSLSSSSLVD